MNLRNPKPDPAPSPPPAGSSPVRRRTRAYCTAALPCARLSAASGATATPPDWSPQSSSPREVSKSADSTRVLKGEANAPRRVGAVRFDWTAAAEAAADWSAGGEYSFSRGGSRHHRTSPSGSAVRSCWSESEPVSTQKPSNTRRPWNSHPRAGSLHPGVGNLQPGVGSLHNRELGFRSQESEPVSTQKPSNTRRPWSSHPPAGNLQPGVGSLQPGVGNLQSGGGALSTQKPSNTRRPWGSHPIVGNLHPGVGSLAIYRVVRFVPGVPGRRKLKTPHNVGNSLPGAGNASPGKIARSSLVVKMPPPLNRLVHVDRMCPLPSPDWTTLLT
eukprot:1187810-Prorocentrum_minimum.AAC.2